MQVLVTGSAGFIGFHLSQRLLDDGFSVTGIDGFTPYYDVRLKEARDGLLRRSPRFASHRLMLEDMASLERLAEAAKPDVLVHLAAQAGVRYSLENPRAYIDANLVGTFNVMELARRHKVRHFLLASTSSVYGDSVATPFRERQAADRPLTLYAATKKAGEEMSHSYSHLWGVPTTALRFFTVYGPWGRPDMAYYGFARAIAAGEPITVYDGGRLRRDFTYIDDIVRGVLGALDRPPEGRVPARLLNIGNHRTEEVGTLVRLLEQALGKRAVVRHAPRPEADVEETFADVDAIAALTGFAPRTTLADGVPRFVAWFRAFHGTQKGG